MSARKRKAGESFKAYRENLKNEHRLMIQKRHRRMVWNSANYEREESNGIWKAWFVPKQGTYCRAKHGELKKK